MPRALNLSLGARDTRRRPVPAPTAVRIARRRSGRSARHAPVALLKQPAGAWRTFSRMRTVKDGEDEEKTVTCILRFSGTKMASAIQYAVWSSATEKKYIQKHDVLKPSIPNCPSFLGIEICIDVCHQQVQVAEDDPACQIALPSSRSGFQCMISFSLLCRETRGAGWH